MPGVKDRVVVVTGSGGGLGREYALLSAAEGARVVVNDLGGSKDGSGRGSAMADDVVAEIRDAGGEAVTNYDDISTTDGAQRVIDTAISTFGAVHGIVNNAGILRDGSFVKMTPESWDAVMKVHLYGSFNITRAAWPHLKEQGFGRIVMATSTSGLFGNFGQANYGAAKAGLVGLLNTLAIEGERSNILVNAVAPMAATRMTEGIAPQDLLDTLPPAFVAPVVGYLLTEESTTTGSVFVAGGGAVYRVAQFQNDGVRFETPPSVGVVAERWSEITDLSGARVGSNPLG
ncbi:serine/threonine protein kinase [Rhodococcus sp. 14-2483-1-1]|uniref:SDR family NAD(P)-dependent oxidoreductase n=1 Tax=Rhodococcus sp. 14-2483-1-1 TaxID=2023148 RepID=UPI000B9BC666|nr:SDR family NAD(P)-dependent oxidoreductase [Rhodococcus sp. 14-2483-1-1]OZF40584.1 serine/threonine protein kinase [Rhodococcus sp. 14-2483-1-1]